MIDPNRTPGGYSTHVEAWTLDRRIAMLNLSWLRRVAWRGGRGAGESAVAAR